METTKAGAKLYWTRVTTNITREEYERIEELAAIQGVTLHAWLRSALLAAIPAPKEEV